jgi:alpha-L-glutamate ligase-like protein
MKQLLTKVFHMNEEVLGINARNLEFIYRLNPRKDFPRVDDKLLTKQILTENGIPTPLTLAVYHSHSELAQLEQHIAGLNGFAVKPATGSGGRGILIVRRNHADELVMMGKSETAALDMEDLKAHVSNILSGIYSMDRPSDKAFFEELLEPESVLGSISSCGLPDVRLIVKRGIPVMAMVRIPTQRSRCRANLHQGAMGLGVDLKTGRTTYAVLGNRNVIQHPDTGKPLATLEIPSWREILGISVGAADCVSLGYIGADIVIDRSRGPVVLELNARPGLNIQLANRKGLARKLNGGETS